MAAIARNLRLLSLQLDERLIALGAGALAVAIGLAVAAGLWLPATALILMIVAFTVGLINWRWSLYGLLAYMPVSGLLILALYPDTAPGTLAKDFMFVLPAYAGFFGTYLARQRRIEFPGAPTVIFCILAVLVVLGAFNPELSDPVIGLIGIKIWLMYIPLMYLGYHFIRNVEDLRLMMKLMVLTGTIPAIVGIAEAILMYTGHQDFVYSLYGDAASDATQGFTAIQIGGGELRRIPSTFSFLTQYYVFLASMVAVTYAWWRLGDGRTPSPRVRMALLGLMLLAALTSGSRGAFVFFPLLLAMILFLDRGVAVRAVGLLAAGSAALVVTVGLIGTNVTALPAHLWENASVQFDIITGGFDETLEHAYAGQGSGSGAGQSRYITGEAPSAGGLSQGYKESWWLKSILELGIAGLIVSAIMFGTVLGRALGIHRRLRDPGLRATSAAFLSLLAWGVIYGFKSPMIDIDPLNVYFWLFAGILFRLPSLDRERASLAPPRRPRARSARSPSSSRSSRRRPLAATP